MSSGCRAHQCFDGMKAVLAEDLTDQQSPQQQLRGNLGLWPTISWIADIPEAEDAASQRRAGDVASGRSSLLFLPLLLLLAGQHQQLGIGRQHLADGILELPPRGDPALYLLGPFRGNAIHVSLPVDHVGQGPSGVPFAAGTATVGFSAARMTQGQGPGELLRQWRQTTNNCKHALAQARGLWCAWFFPHLVAIVLQDQH